MARAELSSDGLKIAIGLPSAVMLVVGGMVGVGIFVNPAVVARSLHSPYLALSAWALGGVVAVLGALIYAELSARMPGTGGEYVYLRKTYGPLAGFLFGWTTLLVVQAGGMAAVAIIFAKNLRVLLGPGLWEPGAVAAVLTLLAGVNIFGVVWGDGVQSALGSAKVLAIAGLIGVGLVLAPHIVEPGKIDAPQSAPGFLKMFGGAMIPVVFSFGGWQTAAYVAGEIKNPTRNLGLALVWGVLTVMALYLMVNLACMNALGPQALGATLTPASDVLRRALGPVGANLAAGAIALSAVAFLSQSMLTGPRVYFAMAKDGLFFSRVGAVAQSSRAPVLAIVLQALWTAVLALSGSYEQILSYVIAMNFLFFGLVASSLFIIRSQDRRAGVRSEGFRTPGHPWTTMAFVTACALVVASSFWAYPVNSLIGYGILLLGVPPYLFWRARGRKETRAQS